MNRRFCAITGYPEEELLSKRVQDITHPAHLEAELAQVQRMLDGEIGSCSMEKRYLRQDGPTVWARQTVGAARKEDGAIEYFISTVEDIPEQKRATTARMTAFVNCGRTGFCCKACAEGLERKATANLFEAMPLYWGYLYHLDAMQQVSFPDINKNPATQVIAPPCRNTPIPGLQEVAGAVDPKTATCMTPPRPVLWCHSSDGTQKNQTCEDQGPCRRKPWKQLVKACPRRPPCATF